MNIFSTTDYRTILKETLEAKKFLDKSYSFQAMASAIRVQKPYISKVINARADFNSDQLYMACVYLGFEEEETSYILLLLEYERCFYPERREVLLKNIEKVQDSKRDSKNIIKDSINSRNAVDFDNSIHIEYYLDPIILIVHMFLTIPRFRKNLDQISKELFITRDDLNNTLSKLVEMKLIEINDGEVTVLVASLHLPRESKVVSSHQNMLKQYGLYRQNRLKVEQKKNFLVTFSSNEKARKEIELEFNNFLSKVKAISMKGKKDHCYQMSFEMFPWSLPL